MKKILLFFTLMVIFSMTVLYTVAAPKSSQPTVSDIEKQKQAADREIKETKAELGVNEKKVSDGLAALRKIDEDITASQKEVETVRSQLDIINGNIFSLETDIASEEADLEELRHDYLLAVKKMRVARKRSSGLAFLFASGSFNEARRRMRYMREFADWKDRRSFEIAGKVNELQGKHQQLTQAHTDASFALKKEEIAQAKLNRQKEEQQVTVNELKANSEALKSKLAKRQADARSLSNQISALIAEQKAKEAKEEVARKAAEEKRLAEERAAAEKAEKERKAAEEKQIAEQKSKETKKQETAKKDNKKQETTSTGTEYAEARKRKARTGTTSGDSKPVAKTETASVASSASGFEGMKGSLPKPVGGSFKIISSFGVHPISPELPDIMDENLGIDAHVANGANACAIYDGEVIKIYDRSNTPGYRNIIVVKHGDYITVYANLETLSVSAGQKVKQGQALGTVGSDFDDPSHGMLHFEVWKNQTHLDPAAWIKI